MAVRAIAAPRALPRARQVDARIVAAVFLGLVGLIGNLGLLGVFAPADHEVVVVVRDLPAGARLAPGDLARARVQVPDDVLTGLIPGDQAGALVGRTLAARVTAHGLLGRDQLAGAGQALGPGQLQVELPLRADSAVVDTLQPGDAVTVLASIAAGKPNAGTHVVLPRAIVARVRQASSSGDARAGLSAIVLTVSQAEALALADAQASGTLVIALAGPEA